MMGYGGRQGWVNDEKGFATLFVVLLVAGCSESTSQLGLPRCGDGFELTGPTCASVYDHCNQNEVALPGGGCKRVGAPATCLKGWKLVKGGWCEPVLPAGKCLKGAMAIIGKATCQPIMDCGSGKYGNIKASVKTIYVDHQYSKSDSDGSKTKPYQSIEEALSTAPSGAHIVVAAGEYLEDLVITKPVTIEGRCPKMVTIKGYKTAHSGTIQVTANDTVIRGLTVTGSHRGVILFNAINVLVERCAISDNASFGLVAESKAEVTMRHSVVQGNHLMGVGAGSGSTVTVDQCEVRDTREKLFMKQAIAYGLLAENDSELTVRDSVIFDNGPEAGISIQRGKGKILRSVIRGTRERSKDTGISASGVRIALDSDLVIQDSLIADNLQTGIITTESTLTVERSVIRDTRPRARDGQYGWGILSRTIMEHMGGKLAVRDSTVSGNSVMGVYVTGGVATLERVVIRDTGSADKSEKLSGGNTRPLMGDGVHVNKDKCPTELSLLSCLVENSARAGLVVFDSKGTICRSVFRGGTYAIVVQTGAGPAICNDNLYENNERNGIAFGQGLKPVPVPRIPENPSLKL